LRTLPLLGISITSTYPSIISSLSIVRTIAL
jgi:hypothetical protein